ncbi:MAG: lipoyl(octanoyl) transferase LipB [Kiritimatiellia bacterium]
MAGVLSIVDLGSDQSYQDVFEMQQSLHARRVAGEIPDTLLLLEHRPVYTLGTSASKDHILWNTEKLAGRGIDLISTSRGGDVTYHGPGQLVGYPIVHLWDQGLKVLEYLTALEEVLIRVAALYGVKAGRDSRNRGVWVGNSKLAALGIRVSRQTTMHGFALNVNTRLGDYNGIVACGLQGVGVTSLQQLSGTVFDMAEVKAGMAATFADVFHYEVR